MKPLEKIIVPTDLSEGSRRAIEYAAWLAAENHGVLTVLHIANEFAAWELYSEEYTFLESGRRLWPTDRVLAEASLDLNRFLEPHLDALRKIPNVTKRLVLGAIPHRIVAVAAEEKADLVVMSPRRHRGLGRIFSGNITDRVTRMSPCPVLSVTPPLASPNWRGKLVPTLFGWPRQSAAGI
jgi:nucleotide-binding universal stress UspA family protein